MQLPSYSAVAKLIDHSLLQPNLTTAELEAGCRLAREYDVATVCILPYFVGRCAGLLAESDVLPTTTIGFPHGAIATTVKAREAERALDDGARELDMVVNLSLVMSGEFDSVRDDIRAVLEMTHARGQKLKVIFECCYLDEQQKMRLCEICGALSVDWVKTSTGYGTSGATLADVTLMRRHSPPHVHVKAAGGIRDLDTMLLLADAGANRCGTSRTREILDELRRRLATSTA